MLNVVAMPSEERAAEGRPKGPLSAFAVPCWGRSGPFSSSGVSGLTLMESSVLADGRARLSSLGVNGLPVMERSVRIRFRRAVSRQVAFAVN